MKTKAIKILKEMDNEVLEILLAEFGHNVTINRFTRGMVEKQVIKKLDEYNDEQIKAFIKKYC